MHYGLLPEAAMFNALPWQTAEEAAAEQSQAAEPAAAAAAVEEVDAEADAEPVPQLAPFNAG